MHLGLRRTNHMVEVINKLCQNGKAETSANMKLMSCINARTSTSSFVAVSSGVHATPFKVHNLTSPEAPNPAKFAMNGQRKSMLCEPTITGPYP